MILQPIVDAAEICAHQGVQQAVLCPGSRCAPLTLAFSRHAEITTYAIPDERSAGFIGLGLSQKNREPVALVCTSGTAAYNFAPAVAEAYYQQLPLIVFTADRPPELIDQWDGQAIRQKELYGRHVKRFYHLPDDYNQPQTATMIHQIVNEALQLSLTPPLGPVHINCPFREPFYPEVGEELTANKKLETTPLEVSTPTLKQHSWEDLGKEWDTYNKKLIVGGHFPHDRELCQNLQSLCYDQSIPLLADVISNLHSIKGAIKHQDAFLGSGNEQLLKELQPDLVVTFGKSVISKNLKLFLRKYQPQTHWHLEVHEEVGDPFQSNPTIIPVSATEFFHRMGQLTGTKRNGREYFTKWQQAETQSVKIMEEMFSQSQFGEFEAVHHIMQRLPENCHLHLANSMPVRLANMVGLQDRYQGVEVFANRGTSGIDGCLSAALGNAINSQVPVVLLTGDLAFFYDRNALWHHYVPPNLRIIILNNHGGGIFRLMDGPNQQPELEEYFETPHALTAEKTAEEFHLDYLFCRDLQTLSSHLTLFFQDDGKAKILEIESDTQANAAIWETFNLTVQKNYEAHQ